MLLFKVCLQISAIEIQIHMRIEIRWHLTRKIVLHIVAQ